MVGPYRKTVEHGHNIRHELQNVVEDELHFDQVTFLGVAVHLEALFDGHDRYYIYHYCNENPGNEDANCSESESIVIQSQGLHVSVRILLLDPENNRD